MNQSNNTLYKLQTNHTQLRSTLFSLIAFCILAVSVTYFVLSIGKPCMGTWISMNGQEWVIEGIDPNGLAIKARIQEGDRPIEINGQSAQTFLEKYEEVGIVFGMLINEMTVIDDSGQLKSVTLKDSSPSRESLIELAILFIVCLIFWIIGFYVFFRRHDKLPALLLCLCGLFVGLAISANVAGERAIPTAFELAVITTVVGPWLLLHFSIILPEERIWLYNNPLVYLIYLPAAITLVLFPMIGYADGQPLPGFRSFRLLEYGAGFVAVASVLVFNYFHTDSIRTRQQMKIILVSCLVAIIPFLVLNIIPGAIWRQTIVPSGFGILFIVFIPLGMGYAVVNQKLMDIDVVIRRGVVYGLITVVMAIILSTAIFFTIAFQESLGIAGQIIVALALSGIAVALFGPARKGIEIQVDRFFYKDRYDYRQIIQSLSNALNLANDTTSVSRLVVGTAVNTLNLSGGVLFVNTKTSSFEVGAAQGIFTDVDKQSQLLELISEQNNNIEFPNSASASCSDLAFLIPISVGEKGVGILCLSQKVSRQDFSANDMYLLQGIASVVAIALHSVILIQDVSIRDTFVSVASHELRTPLTAIVGYADLLIHRDPTDVTRRRWLKHILDNSQKVSAIVDDLLNVSRIQSGKINVKLERVSLSDILDETVTLIRESTDKHEFVVDIESNLSEVFVDRDKFNQVVGNLLSNAVKYSPNGGRITLAAYNDLERRQIVVSVADEGIGISPEDRDLLFTTFHRIQRPETQGIRGSGLGLYIAKEWIEAMRGTIWLESELNKGSTFFVAIPTQDSVGTS